MTKNPRIYIEIEIAKVDAHAVNEAFKDLKRYYLREEFRFDSVGNDSMSKAIRQRARAIEKLRLQMNSDIKHYLEEHKNEKD